MRIIVITLFSWMIFSTGCEEKSSVTFEQTLTHPNGLVANVPAGFDATETTAGYLLSETADVRSPRRISLYFTSELDAAQSLSQVRDIPDAEKPVNFAVTALGAGSGGTEYELIAVKSVTGGFVTVKAVEQSERGEPSFVTAWALLEVARRP